MTPQDPSEQGRVRVHVDPATCQGHNRCVITVPDLVEVDDLGFAHEIGDGSVPAGRISAARLAVNNCPERAISLIGDER